MKENSHKAFQLPQNNNKGFILVLMVIIFAAIISVVLIKTALSSITQTQTLSTYLQKTEAELFNNTCMQEALVNLNRDNEYTGETLTLGDGNCDISINEDVGNYTITVSSNINNMHITRNSVASLNPYQIVSWDN